MIAQAPPVSKITQPATDATSQAVRTFRTMNSWFWGLQSEGLSSFSSFTKYSHSPDRDLHNTSAIKRHSHEVDEITSLLTSTPKKKKVPERLGIGEISRAAARHRKKSTDGITTNRHVGCR